MKNHSRKRFTRTWRLGLLFGLGFMVAITLAWFLAGRKIWTDGRGLSVIDSQARLREVVWNAPQPLGKPVEEDQQQYEPCISPDGTELYFVGGKPGHNADIYVCHRRNNAWSPRIAKDCWPIGASLLPDCGV